METLRTNRTTETNNEELNHIYRLYDELILKLEEPFYKGKKLLEVKVNNSRVGISEGGIGNQIGFEDKVLVEGYAHFSLRAISEQGDKILKYLEGEVRDRFERFWKIMKEYEVPDPSSNPSKEEKRKAREVKVRLIKEFKEELFEKGLNLGTLKLFQDENRFGRIW